MQVLDRRPANRQQPRQQTGQGPNFKKFRKNQIGKVASLSEVIAYCDHTGDGPHGGFVHQAPPAGVRRDIRDELADADFNKATAKQNKRRR